MKTSLAAIFLLASLPINAHQSLKDYGNHKTYTSQRGYSYGETCFRYEYREDYIPGTLNSPGFVKSYKEKVAVPCSGKNNASYDKTSKTEYVNYVDKKNCNGSTTLGGLIGGGIAASLSKKDAYGWSIPLGAVLGAGLGNSECNN